MTFALHQQHHLYLVGMSACISQNPLKLIKKFMKTHPYSPIPRNAYTPIPTKAKQSHTHTHKQKKYAENWFIILFAEFFTNISCCLCKDEEEKSCQSFIPLCKYINVYIKENMGRDEFPSRSIFF